MENTPIPTLSVSDFIALTNQTLEYAYPRVMIEGEVASFKVNQAKYVFFDLKDAEGSIGCFMTVWQLKVPIEDGMKVMVEATPKLTKWGKFSLTVQSVYPSGAGSIKRSFDLLKSKLEGEGLFAEDRKRPLPETPQRLAVVSSTGAAGYADFIKILSDRWGGLQIDVAHVQVQGKEAPEQMIRALRHFNGQETPPEVIVIIRGGGSADDLSAFNDESLVREIAASRVPTLVGVGHETDTSLADLAADVRAATPSNAAQIVVPDRVELRRRINQQLRGIALQLDQEIERKHDEVNGRLAQTLFLMRQRHEEVATSLKSRQTILGQLDPGKVLSRGYAIVRGDINIGHTVEVETRSNIAIMEVKNVRKK